MLGIELYRDCDTSLSRQIYQTLRKSITDGQMAAGDLLPSTRELARELAVSRNTVTEAYEMLSAEGYTTSRQGSPTKVSEGLLLEVPPSSAHCREAPAPVHTILADFQTGKPDLRQFPRYQWLASMRRAFENLPLEQFGYTGPEGLPVLREEIASWLFRSRGLQVSADDIFITAGATHALHLIADLLCRDGRGIIMEDPCHMGMLRVLRSKNYPIIPVPVDEQGLRTDLLENIESAVGSAVRSSAGAVYVTPSHQFPLGGILPAARRAALIRFARENSVLYH